MKNITELSFSGYKFLLYYAEVLNHEIAEYPHNHAQYEIYYVLDGQMRVDIAGNVQEIAKGHACMLARDIRHHVYYEPDVPHHYFACIFDLIPLEQLSVSGPDGANEYADIRRTLEPVDKRGFCMLCATPQMQEVVTRWSEVIEQRQLGWNTQLVMLCYQLVIFALQQLCTTKIRDQAFSGKENLAMAVSMYIHEHYPENISVESAAKALNVSPRHINRAYKSWCSTTFMKNVSLLRIAYAKNYLCSTDYSIDKIAEKIGFSSSRALYKLFQKYEGLSLSQYREQHRPQSRDTSGDEPT
jgi:AraC-like DNA-binding protein/mannose-6-phosphate isomerase-like protein (cupin superfamily)